MEVNKIVPIVSQCRKTNKLLVIIKINITRITVPIKNIVQNLKFQIILIK